MVGISGFLLSCSRAIRPPLFKVSVRIECPSQPWNWIKSQEQEVREWVLKRIDRAINGETDEDEEEEA